MKSKIFILLTLVYISFSTLTLQEYPDYELESPQLIFDQIQPNSVIQHPQINKLVFITPWNARGKDLTIKYAQKLKYISPCWYELIIRNGQIMFENDQLHDQEYLTKIKQVNAEIKIIPRVYVNNFDVFRYVGANSQNFEKAIYLILNMIQRHKFDGIVWDSPYNLFMNQKNVAPLNRLIGEFVNTLRKGLQNMEKQMQKQLKLFFNMANPSMRNLDVSLYKNLNIDGLLIQNYDTTLDFVQMVKNSISWVQKTKLTSPQIIMMLPFFSYKNGQGISTLDVSKQLQTDNINFSGFDRSVCKFISSKRNTYLVPCYKYFSDVYKLLSKQKYSAGYWQGGNGLQNYYLFM